MSKQTELLQIIPQQGMLPLFFNKDPQVSIEVLRALYAAGIRAVEYTNRGEEALQNFGQMRQAVDTEMQGMYLGIGTIKNAQAAYAFADAGADFLISPGLSEEVVQAAKERNLLYVPGCMTPSEIIRAEQLGAKMIKLFPGNILGPSFLSGIKEIFPGLLFMPTGGVEAEEKNLQGWFKAGVVAVGMGSKLITKELVAQKDYAGIEAATRQAMQLIAQVSGKPQAV
jgi:2-dehydro-3-deoxyphosphogluconate aldolase/(4S)-4-hydroxy-2-oxoglutarate aldolase